MSKWAERRRTIHAESDYDPLTSIPMLEEGLFDETLARKRITDAFDAAHSRNIVILDPYLLSSDIALILELFATQADRNITVITHLNRIKGENGKSPPKLEEARRLEAIVSELNQKGIFSSFEIIVTKFDFHDRFFFCTDEDKDGVLLASGGSLSMLLKSYSGLIRINNRTFRRMIAKFVQLAQSDGWGLPQYIQENHGPRTAKGMRQVGTSYQEGRPGPIAARG
ncbi:hypothetical protein G9Q38_03735 [Pusillimonas sp. DMV24BSW_D]|uniref:hypothetical protein n=1 Tax=Neopusillimonas aestuarii TaxID=2716226 RepID=UPI0014076CDA|nr:hypothetical protein [Pusillimonas sp. DMV24BSW_D]QIM48346.1 hypothetical protein G9Q38_03735 [Pusillimonas sp. DMV24BSW_D]